MLVLKDLKTAKDESRIGFTHGCGRFHAFQVISYLNLLTEMVVFLKSASRKDKRRAFVFYIISTVIIIYISVPTYGVIRDIVGDGETVFSLNSPLPDIVSNPRGAGFMEKLRGFLFPSENIPVVLGQRVDVFGRVLYTDGTPFANGSIGCFSDARLTRTDRDGYFEFLDLEEGSHTIRVFDEDGNVLAQCNTVIMRSQDAEKAAVVKLPDGTIVFNVSIDLAVLKITVLLEKDAQGNVVGIESIEIGFIEPEKDGEEGAASDKVEPEFSTPTGERFEFNVQDTVTSVPYGGQGETNVNIFGLRKRIAPGSKGTYQFTVDNRSNNYAARYELVFEALDTLPKPYKIPIVYRLEADGNYVAGGQDSWLTYGELKQENVLGAKEHVKYTLHWFWPDGENDAGFADFADDERYSYTLVIKVRAEKG